jgi:hypothetical protein
MERLPSDPQEAFRAGLADEPARAARPGLAEAGDGWAGPNEALLLATTRLSGLSEPGAAFETGRALRSIARLLDAARAPEAVGLQFRDNVAAALVAHRSKGRPEAWDGAATVDMFMEMYGRILGFDDSVFGRLRDRLIAAAKGAASPVGTGATRSAAS